MNIVKESVESQPQVTTTANNSSGLYSMTTRRRINQNMPSWELARDDTFCCRFAFYNW